MKFTRNMMLDKAFGSQMQPACARMFRDPSAYKITGKYESPSICCPIVSISSIVCPAPLRSNLYTHTMTISPRRCAATPPATGSAGIPSRTPMTNAVFSGDPDPARQRRSVVGGRDRPYCQSISHAMPRDLITTAEADRVRPRIWQASTSKPRSYLLKETARCAKVK